MSTHKAIDRICIAAIILSMLLLVVFVNGRSLGIQSAERTMGYEERLFDTSVVHTIDIVMDDWDAFLESCENEEYSVCAVVIDGEAYQNVGIRAKGNTSLSTVSALDSDRYSFKVEFDQYDSTKSYYGLDKLSLNNLIQDNTCMKDYLTYRLMAEFGVSAPLCSYVYVTVNGEDWGLYLAVEGVEDAFLQRNYGNDSGVLYKPDSTSFGAGRGNGEAFDPEDFMDAADASAGSGSESAPEQPTAPESENGLSSGGPPVVDTPAQMPEQGSGETGRAQPSEDSGEAKLPETFSNSDAAGLAQPQTEGMDADGFGQADGGMGSGDVKLQYSGDDPDSYANIFDNAKTDVTAADETRLIASLKKLGAGEELESVVDIDQVLRYFVVHNYVVNGDSYTGSMVHNYYLYEQDGQLSMIPWDYNLAFGGFNAADASAAVNDPIDTPLSVTGDGDRPMIDWIFSSEAYTELYHTYFSEFLDTVDVTGLIEDTRTLIASYVERDPTKFCTYDEFETGVEALITFCRLRTESIRGQLDGTIPSTDEGQSEDASALVDTGALNLTDMGSMNSTGAGAAFPAGSGQETEFAQPPDGFGSDTGRQAGTGQDFSASAGTGTDVPEQSPPGA